MPLKINILKNIKMIKGSITSVFILALLVLNGYSQERVKVDGVAVVVGKNIVLDSDIEKFKQEIEMRSEGKIIISDCEMLEEIMLQKLLSHHAVIDSIVVSDDRVEEQVNNTIGSFTQQLGDLEKVVEFYGFNDEEDLRKELSIINREQFLIQGERAGITAEVDVTPDEVRTYFNSLKEADVLPEFGAEIELSQIVIYAKPSEEEVERVIARLNQIKKEVEAGSSMNMKAVLNSDDPSVSGTGQGAGGFYSINRQSQFVKEFKEVAFSLEEGQVSEPFESDFGYHILKVEKIKGQQVDLRHILIQAEIDDAKLKESKDLLEKIIQDIADSTITFEKAVLRYSQDIKTRYNKGTLINPGTGDSYFELTRMDPSLYSRVVNLNSGDITEPYYDETREGEKMFKILLLKSKSDTHIANYVDDYVKIQELALQKKQEEEIEKWADDKIKDTYIKINKDYKDCSFDRNWKKDEK
ncbi:MAG: peptidylprolyl isomerase [Flavobacteriaceae bacterium]|nr:peptidylprolyl isomerase [Flavobacteriaceae bacterium]